MESTRPEVQFLEQVRKSYCLITISISFSNKDDQALQKFFASLVQYANTSFETLLESLISIAKPSQSGGLSKQALSSIAQCVAVLCLAAGNNAADLGIHIVLL
ncbi:cullin-associated NEDD8-dissociated protein 1 [Hordeum vulgare]|nr:cullin-associated NEDD8-dissociated protein 1 [Hordeum vulgare]